MKHKSYIMMSGQKVPVTVHYEIINNKPVLGRTYTDNGMEVNTDNFKQRFYKELK